MENKIIYPTGFKAWGTEEILALYRVMASDWYTYGSEVKALEEELAAYHGRKYCIATNSGSSANWLAIAALTYKEELPLLRGDTVVAPSCAWATTWSPLIQHGLDVVLVDVDDTWNAPRRSVSNTTELIVTCPILGNPAHVAEWWDYAQAESIYCIEDACESLGAITADGRKIGTLGHISTISMYMSHQIAGIEGGAALTDDEELATLMRQLSSHGWTRDTHTATVFEDEYKFVVPGMNLRPTELTAAVQREQLKKLDALNVCRVANAEYFADAVRNLSIRLPQTEPEAEQSPFALHFECEDNAVRSRLVPALRAQGVDCRLPTGGSARKHPMMAHYTNQQTPRADLIHERGLFIGCPPFVAPDLIDAAVKVMRDVL